MSHPDSDLESHFQPHHGGPEHHNLHDEMIGLAGATAHQVLNFEDMPYIYDTLPVPADIMASLVAANATRSS